MREIEILCLEERKNEELLVMMLLLLLTFVLLREGNMNREIDR